MSAIVARRLRQACVRRVMVIAGLSVLAVMVLVPEVLELLELGQLVVDLRAGWKRL